MKTQINILKGIVLILFMSMFITAAFSQNPGSQAPAGRHNQELAPPLPPGVPAPPPPPAFGMPDVPIPPVAEISDLSVDQKEKIRQADLDHMKTMTPLKNQIMEKKTRLQTILTTAPFDPKAADQVAEELGKIETTTLKELIRHDQFLRNLLTPQQQIVFDARPKPFLHQLP